MESGPGGGTEHMENKVYSTHFPVLIHSKDLLRGKNPQPKRDTPSTEIISTRFYSPMKAQLYHSHHLYFSDKLAENDQL